MSAQYLYGYDTNDEIYVISKKIKHYSFEQALEIINNIIDKYPQHPECYMMKAGLFYVLGEYNDSVIKNYTEAISLNNTTAVPYHSRGIVLVDENLFDDAIDDFSTVIEKKILEHRDYVLSSCYAFRVISYCALGYWDEASKDINFLDEKFITYNTSISGMINKDRLINCIEQKVILM